MSSRILQLDFIALSSPLGVLFIQCGTVHDCNTAAQVHQC